MDSKVDLREPGLKRIDLSGLREFFVNFLIPLISLVATAALFFFVLSPLYKNVPVLEIKLSSKMDLATQLQRKVSVLDFLIDLEPVVEEHSNLVNKTLVSEPKIPELLAQIDQMVVESGLVVDQLGYSKGGTSSESIGYDSIAVALSLEGSGDGLLEFLRKVENASRFVLIDDFYYDTNKREGETGLDTHFRLLSLYLKVESDAVTDEGIELNISDPKFLSVMEDLKNLHYYDISLEDLVVEDVKETTPSEVVVPEAETGGALE